MSDTPATTKHLRILLACARPMAGRTLKVDVRLRSVDNGPAAEALDSLLRNRLKLTILERTAKGDRIHFHLSAPLPDPAYPASVIRKSAGVLDVSFTEDCGPIDVLRPGEERQSVINGLHALDRSVAVDILDHVKPQDLREHLDAAPGYDVLYLVCHGDASGNLLLEDGRGWARFVGARELAEIVGGRVKILILGACHGERGLAGLIAAPETQRPPVIIYSQGEYPIPSRAVHLFTEGFFRRLAEGNATTDAFRRGVECVRYDDDIGEVRCPDGMLDAGPSPYKRLRMNETLPASFPAIARGRVDLRDLQAPTPPHRKTTRSDDHLLGRQIDIARLMEELLPPEQQKHVKKLIAILQGHPLSIFLAAHRIAAGPEPIVQQLIDAEKNMMELLDAGELAGVPIRQRSLRASLGLSYGRLSDRAREIFRKGSQFPAGLYRHVPTLDNLLGEDWREAAQETADIGLVRFERDAQRYWMLNPVREYAEDLLEQEGGHFKREVADHWSQFTAFQNVLLNPSQALEDCASLNLPSDARERQEELARLHDNACTALRAEEANILFSFRWALRNDAATAERIATCRE